MNEICTTVDNRIVTTKELATVLGVEPRTV